MSLWLVKIPILRPLINWLRNNLNSKKKKNINLFIFLKKRAVKERDLLKNNLNLLEEEIKSLKEEES